MKPESLGSLTGVAPAAMAELGTAVDFLAAVEGQGDDRFDVLVVVDDLFAGQAALENVLCDQHDERSIANVQTGGQFAGVLGVEVEPDVGEEAFGAVEVTNGQIVECLLDVKHG